VTTLPWPCSCGGAGVKNLGVDGYCAAHLGELFESLDPSVFTINGLWLQDGLMRPDHGAGWAECRCLACAATAVALVGSPCSYCELARARMIVWQAETLLHPELPDDGRRPDALRSWAHRLAGAVREGVVDEGKARAAWHREVTRERGAA
jgi:hypothetical protein